MSKSDITKLSIYSVVVILFCWANLTFSETEIDMQGGEVGIGINNPFEPIQQNVSRGNFLGSNGRNGAQLQVVIPDRVMKSVMLKFLRAENLESVVSGLLGPYGAVSVDSETNTIIICDEPENLEKIVTEIRKADQTPKQILVEVVILNVQLNDDTEIGVNWDNLFVDSDGAFKGSTSYTQGLNTLTTGGALTLISDRISTTVKALQQERNTEILASPRLLVLSGQEAYLETVEEIPYTELTETGSGGGVDNPVSSTMFKDVGISLMVKPTITDEGKILLEINPDQSINTGIAGVGNTTVPIVNKRMIRTSLLINDGQVVVLGGLRNKEVRINNDKIPLLGDIPIIGGLFSSDKEVIEYSELLIMISLHICEDDIPLSNDEMIRWKEGQSLKPVRLEKKVRGESELVKGIVPQNESVPVNTIESRLNGNN